MTTQTVNKADQVIIFDTTLRDGEQSAGAGLTVGEKIRIAHQLARLNVDVIEAGFAGSSPGDFEAVRRIAHEVEGPSDLLIGASRRFRYRSRSARHRRSSQATHSHLHLLVGRASDAPDATRP